MQTAEIIDARAETAPWPLYVDLDRTLLRTDVLWESFVAALQRNPLIPFLCVIWLLQGLPVLKRKLSEAADLPVETLPANDRLITYLTQEKQRGSKIYLATAAERIVAEKIAARFGFFDGVLATDTANNKGRAKLARIIEQADGPFRYAGDHMVDAPILQASAGCTLVNPSRKLVAAVDPSKVEFAIHERPVMWRELLRAIRPHQWVKNLLVFVPLLAASLFTIDAILAALAAFVAFSLTASAVYIVNDLCDLAADRVHPKKRNRPFAAGRLPIELGIATAPVLFVLGMAAALTVSPALALVLAIYAGATFAYSLGLKRVHALDVVMLAMLFTIRVLGGAAAIAVVTSFWLLSFSFLLFLSLAITKRYSELYDLAEAGKSGAAGRGYRATDIPIIGTVGVSSGLLSVLVFALYINSEVVQAGFLIPELLWPICVLLFYWIIRLWVSAGRGEVDQDPIVYVVKDPLTWGIGALVSTLFLLAKLAPFSWLA